MRSIKVRVLMTVIVCTLLTAFICGGVSVFNSSKTVYEDSKKELQYACENQAAQLDRKMGNVEQAVTTVHQVALQQLTDMDAFKTDKAYVDNYITIMSQMLYEVAGNTEGAMTAYIFFYNPDFKESESGVF